LFSLISYTEWLPGEWPVPDNCRNKARTATFKKCLVKLSFWSYHVLTKYHRYGYTCLRDATVARYVFSKKFLHHIITCKIVLLDFVHHLQVNNKTTFQTLLYSFIIEDNGQSPKEHFYII
jgi:hypothetical protein